MPDVGVLQLTIQDNSKAAGQGLDFLAGALGRIKTAVSGGINLEGVSSEVTKLATVINGAKGTSSIISKLGTMFNAISKFSQIKGFSMKADEIREYAQNLGSAADALERNEKLTERNRSDTNYWDNMLGTDNAKQAISKIEKNVDVFEDTISRAKEIADGSGNYCDTFMRMGAFTSTPGKDSSFSQLTTDIDGLDKVASTVFITVENHVDTATASVSKMKNEVSDLINYLDKPISYKGLRDVADITAGVTRNNTNIAAEAAKSFDDKFFARLDKVNSEIDKTFEALNNPPNAEKNWTSAAFDQAMGIKEQYEGLINEDTSIFNTPELIEYLELLEMARQDLADYGNEHERIEKQIQYNGATEERIKALEQMENSYYLALSAEQMFKAKIEEIISSNKTYTEGTKEATQATTEQSEAMQKVAEASASMNESSDNVKEKIKEAVAETDKLAESTNKAVWMAADYEQKFSAILAEKQQEAALAAQIRASQESSFYAEKPVIGMEQTNMMADNLTKLDLLKAQLQEAEIKYNQFVNELGAGASKTIKAGLDVQRLRDAIWQYNNALQESSDAQEEAETSAFSLSGAWSALKGAMTRMFPTLTGLMKRFKSMTTMRAMRYVIRQLAAGFSEGVQNVYQYSKAVGTSLAPAMDQAATALQQMKNSIGAAVAPVIQALVPVLQTVVNWLITGINYLNQFFALLNGQSTWTRALPEAAEAFEKNTKAAKGTSKAMKDLLADWDELNIIQSQNAGGSGSGTGKTAEEYKNMFEEVNSFDDKVKNALAFIDEHLGGLSEIIKKAGIALLGWKFSKAFAGLLGTLGKLVAGGAIVAIGLDLSYGAAYDAGAKGYFDTQDILRSIIGGLAAAIGGSLITTALGMGGVLGFGIGLMAAAVVTIVGYCQGEQDLKDKNKWGNLTWTQDQIEQFVREQFTFPVDAEIDVFDAHLKSETDAKNQVDEAVGKFNKSLEDAEHIVADIDTSTPEQKVAAVKQAAQDAQEAIKALQSLIDANENGLTYTLTNFTFKNAEGEDITADLLDSIQVSNTTLRNYFNNVGQDLAKLMLEGEKSGWKNGEMDAALELMASQKRIYDRAAELKDKMTFETQASSAVKGVVSRETALSIYEEQKKKLEEYEATVKKTVENEADNLMYLATLAESAAEEVGFDTEQGQKLHQAYLDYLADYNLIMDDLDGAVEDRLKETKQKMADEWSKVLLEVYGDDFVEAAKRLGNNGLYVATLGDSVFGDYEWDSINRRDIADSANRLYTILLQDMTAWNEDYNGLVNYYVGSLGGKLFDLISEDAKKVIAEKLLTHADNAGNAFQIFKAMFGLDEETAKRYIDPGYQDIWADALEEQPPVEFVPNVEVDENALLEQMKTEVEDALQDGQLDLDEQFDLMVKFSELGLGVNALDDVLKELEYNLDEEGYSTGRLNPKQFVASSTGIHGAYTPGGEAYSPYFVYPNQQATTSEDTIMSEEDYANAVETGASRANRDQNDILNSIMRGVEALLRKEWTVNVSPSSDWGNHNAKSGQAWYRVIGG